MSLNSVVVSSPLQLNCPYDLIYAENEGPYVRLKMCKLAAIIVELY